MNILRDAKMDGDYRGLPKVTLTLSSSCSARHHIPGGIRPRISVSLLFPSCSPSLIISSDSEGTDTDSDAEDESAALASDIASLKANLTEEVKLVLVVNDSLKMAKGKIAAQAGHATLACALMVKDVNPKVSRFP